ncbi:hypothetical protein L226DRAFT_499391 [Lentinus tigrinus ALCF2SS1-7]|uniref:Galactose oxidase n=1 Tax=Lentinus tigrinus ALCF2SS1-6 TaxID=1328759 RepID=A0A5C2SWR7_9APHY|nr:hypothetical protein L227DRAFT_538354 [Lentinus tigrinus ALCF2SS1-6]RPD81249.1 hypothetical protein L226DRAFT_499391 [Lentinus tigrinus ALCF2SS1-7]
MSLGPSRHARHVLLGLLVPFLSCLPTVRAQTISTSMPVPPLQWIELTDLLGGSAAPPLKDATIGYDDTNRILLIFGGESQQGFPAKATYTLDLSGLQWSTPTPPTGLDQTPSVRTAMIGGDDSAASYRHGHVVIDGESSSDSAVADVWEYDYTSKFWAQVGLSPGGPSARWGGVGGIDPRTSDSQGTVLNNTIYMAGGYDGKNLYPLSEIWQLSVGGTLSSNLPNSVTGSWSRVNVDSTIPGRVSVGGTMVGHQVVAVGGCKSAASQQSILDSSCAVQDAQVIDTASGNIVTPQPCLAPRIDPAVVPNMNGASSSFSSQAFVLFGTFNSTLWNDGGGSARGEVDVLDIGTGAWARVLPSGDPGSNGKPKYPVPRQGAAALSWSKPLVGDTSIAASDTIIFGGRDAAGNYLSDVWLLRAYNATLTKTNQTWSGFGSGTLASGVSANGAGVTVEYMTQCAAALSKSSTSSGTPTSTSGSSTESSGSGSSTGQASSSPSVTFPYNTSAIHKSLAAVSVALFFPAVALYRLSAPSIISSQLSDRNLALMYLGIIVGVAAYALGVVGFATSFTSITTSSASSLARRSASSLHLKTSHAQAGVALFAGLYVLVPLLQLIALCLRRPEPKEPETESRLHAESTAEKSSMNERAGSPSARSEPVASQRSGGKRRVRSWAGIGTWAGITGRRSNETAATDEQGQTPSQRSFEVVNRPIRQRRASGNSLAAFSDPRPTHTPRNLSDMSWLDPRLNTNGAGGGVSPVDRREPWTPGTTPMEITSTNGLMMSHGPPDHPVLPAPFEGLVHLLFHAFLLALTVLSLVALWQRAPKAAFGVFLAWTVVFYAVLFVLAWFGHPRESILSVIFSRLRTEPAFSPSVAVPFPSDGRGPYQHHQPPYRANGIDHDYATSHGHMSPDVDDDDDEDEETRQRRIEEELSRRDVSIVTVPRRRLYLLNPNPPEEEGS